VTVLPLSLNAHYLRQLCFGGVVFFLLGKVRNPILAVVTLASTLRSQLHWPTNADAWDPMPLAAIRFRSPASHLPCRLRVAPSALATNGAPTCSRHERWRAVPGSGSNAKLRTSLVPPGGLSLSKSAAGLPRTAGYPANPLTGAGVRRDFPYPLSGVFGRVLNLRIRYREQLGAETIKPSL
jgi:hypothetical protein